MREELADVIVYAIDFADALGFEDLDGLIKFMREYSRL